MAAFCPCIKTATAGMPVITRDITGLIVSLRSFGSLTNTRSAKQRPGQMYHMYNDSSVGKEYELRPFFYILYFYLHLIPYITFVHFYAYFYDLATSHLAKLLHIQRAK